LLRNAAVVLGNQRPAEGLAALIRRLGDNESIVRGACAWALGRYTSAQATEALRSRLAIETDDEVRQEIDAALLESASAE
jgi:epoxyqueuosine reductase